MAEHDFNTEVGTGELCVERDLFRASREHCRLERPELLLAGQMLPRPRRFALYCTMAVIDQLREILGDPFGQRVGGTDQPVELSVQGGPGADPGAGPGACGSSEHACQSEHGDGKSCDGDGSGDCGSCGNSETLQQRQGVCHSVMDYLYRGEPTGKGELDGFKAVAQAAGLPRAWFDSLINSAGDGVDVARYATWQRFREHCVARAGAQHRLLVKAAMWDWNQPLTRTAAHQIDAWGTAACLMDHLMDLGPQLAQGRLLVPLDDLITCKLSETDIKVFAQAGCTGDPPDGRWLAFIELQTKRIDSLLQGVGALAKTLPPSSRRAAMVINRLLWERWQRFVNEGANAFASSPMPAPSYWQRMGGVFRAVGGVGSRK